MSEQQPVNSDEISLKELILKIREWWRYLKTQWWKILIAGFLGGVIGFVYASMQPITYTAKITFVVEEGKSGGSMGGLASLAGQFGVDVGGSSGGGLLSSDNILLYFKSHSLAREVLLSKYDSTTSQSSIADVYADVYKLREGWSKNGKVGNIKFPPYSNSSKYSRLQDSLLQNIIGGILSNKFIVSKTEKKAGFIDVSTKMESEALAKVYCEKVVQIAVDRYLNVKTQRQKLTVEKLQARVDSIANLLSRKTASGAALQTSSSTMDINPLYRTGTAVAVETTMRDKTMLATIFASVTQNLEIAKFTLSQETPVIQIVDDIRYPLVKNKTSRLKNAVVVAFFFGITILIILLIRKYLNLKFSQE